MVLKWNKFISAKCVQSVSYNLIFPFYFHNSVFATRNKCLSRKKKKYVKKYYHNLFVEYIIFLKNPNIYHFRTWTERSKIKKKQTIDTVRKVNITSKKNNEVLTYYHMSKNCFDEKSFCLKTETYLIGFLVFLSLLLRFNAVIYILFCLYNYKKKADLLTRNNFS